MDKNRLLKVIAIDDEDLGLSRIKELIDNQALLSFEAGFNDPIKALEYLEKHAIDLVFTDIEMLEMNGIDLGHKINELNPNIIIVYVTAYKEYALDAFKNYAFGYLLKPVTDGQLTELVTKIATRFRMWSNDEQNSLKIDVVTFGGVKIQFKDQDLHFRTKKAKEMFFLLIHHEGRSISSDYISEMLWPDIDPETQKKYLHTHMYYCRKALKSIGLSHIIEFKLEQYKINMDYINWDYDVFNQTVQSKQDGTIKSEKEYEMMLVSLYHGPYLYYEDYLWTHELRERAKIIMDEFLEE